MLRRTGRALGEVPKTRHDIIEETATRSVESLGETFVTSRHRNAIERALSPQEMQLIEGITVYKAKNLSQLAFLTSTPRSQIKGKLIGAMEKVAKQSAVLDSEAKKRIRDFVESLASRIVYNPQELETFIRLELQFGVPPHATYWIENPNIYRLYEAAYLRDKNGSIIPLNQRNMGLGFFGYGNWYDYLQKRLGFSAVRKIEFEGREYLRKRFFNEEINSQIKTHLEKGVPPYSVYWKNQPELQNLFQAAQFRDKNGQVIPGEKLGKISGFFGHGDWDTYLQKEQGISSLRKATYNGRTFVRGEYYPEEIKTQIETKLKKEKIPPFARYWSEKTELARLYNSALWRDKDGKPIPENTFGKVPGFFGHGNWYTFLEKEIGINTLKEAVYKGKKYKRMSRYSEEIHSLIKKKLNDGIPSYTAYWQSKPELAELYNAVLTRDSNGNVLPKKNLKGRGFFGNGDWYTYLQKELGISAMREAEYNGRKYSRGYYKNELNYRILAKLKDGEPESFLNWHRTKELSNLYYAVRERKFFGYGTWKKYIEVLKSGKII